MHGVVCAVFARVATNLGSVNVLNNLSLYSFVVRDVELVIHIEQPIPSDEAIFQFDADSFVADKVPRDPSLISALRRNDVLQIRVSWV